MKSNLFKYKGIHPGIVLDRELKKRSIKQRPFALLIGEYPQTLNKITSGKRNIPVGLALKIEKTLQLAEGTISLLQTYYNIEKEKKKEMDAPDLSLIRNALFWDTDIERIDWTKQDRAVIERIFERGNDVEKNEITRFYGRAKVNNTLRAIKRKPMTLQRKSK
ncbi:helix-turn-helix transcriptional regulator [Chryseobacterium profundimaris]|uniref:Plasmid maintenance system antidote protein VapI, contains XRE-type HTH domain n=1 Tax=Chryseobacterium profundimaris TaxID=1387275 RepID=A0ABY1PH87_9FLAO|nr:helix-turn-helix domain-containing protein [Chryseobacterium profundimaris]SMP33635.1 Plasmid maintenance system antidote protein VapI, contains XRE-type HTH domain [Chryseobacterium profundimaris]